DAAVHGALRDMDMGLLYGPLEAAVREFVLDALFVSEDRCPEIAACDGGDRGDLVKPVQPGAEVATVMVVVAGHGRHRRQEQDEEQEKESISSRVWHRGLLLDVGAVTEPCSPHRAYTSIELNDGCYSQRCRG